jgi:hypothetical protein
VGVDPFACRELLEQRAIEPSGGAIVDVLDARLLAELCRAQPRGQSLVPAPRDLFVEQQGEPVRVNEILGLVGVSELGEGLGHSVEAEGVELIEGGMSEHVGVLLNGSNGARGCWNGGSERCPRGAWAPASDRAWCRGWI